MPTDAKTPQGFSLKRWSRRKFAAARESAPADQETPLAPTPARDENVPVAAAPAMPGPATEPALPPVESLTIDSDFTAYLQPEVDESVKRQALRKLFADPRFNVMDGLDVYIDDYTKADPIPPDVLERLMKMHFEFKPSPAELPQGPTVDASTEAARAAPASLMEPAAATVPALGDTASAAQVTSSHRPDATQDPPDPPDTHDPAAPR